MLRWLLCHHPITRTLRTVAAGAEMGEVQGGRQLQWAKQLEKSKESELGNLRNHFSSLIINNDC